MRNFDRSLPMLLLQAREATMAHFRPVLAEFGLTEQQWRVVRVLSEAKALDAKELAQRALILKPSLTGVLDRLERDGLVSRRRVRDDGRKLRLHLTRKGQRLFELIGPRLEAEYARMQERFSNRQWEDLYASLEHLIQLNGSKS